MPDKNTQNTVSGFLRCWLGAVSLFVILGTVSLVWEPYHYFPAYGFIGYAITIALLLFALAQSEQLWHYVLVSFTLIKFGAVAGFDIVLSRQEIAEALAVSGELSWLPFQLTVETLDDYVNILVLILNIFTGSLAGNSLFYGLNRRNFE
ncbi:hypothetical protein [Spongorhabdus nitratireducens]